MATTPGQLAAPSIPATRSVFGWAAARVRPLSDEHSRLIPSAATLGWLPLVALVVGLGALILALADASARYVVAISEPLFWGGLAVVYIPVVMRLFAARASRTERVGLVLLLGVGLYWIKVLHSPIQFTLYDELLHSRTIADVLRSSHLFEPNPILPVSPYYPGLEIATDAVVKLTGLAAYPAGIILLGAARGLMTVSLYLIFEHIGGSPRVAGVGVTIYSTGSNFIFWGIQFAYQSLALPISIFALYVLVYRAQVNRRQRLRLGVVALTAMIAVVATHHITMFLLCAFLVLWIVIESLWGRILPLLERLLKFAQGIFRQVFLGKLFAWLLTPPTTVIDPLASRVKNRHRLPYWFVVAGIVMAIVYLFYVASPAVSYLASPLIKGVSDLIGLITGELKSRTLFSDNGGNFVTPPLEQLSGFMATGLIGLGLVFGTLYGWQRLRTNRLAMTMLVVAALFPATYALRLSSSSWEISNRLTDFLMIAVSFIVAFGVVSVRVTLTPRLWRFVLIGVLFYLMLVGGINTGVNHWDRMPGPYLADGDARSVEIESTSMARWVLANLGPYHNTNTDRSNAVMLGALGQQNIIPGTSGGDRTFFIYYSLAFDDYPQQLIRQTHIRYLITDHRLTQYLPLLGYYFESGEPRALRPNTKQPLNSQMLTKFDAVPFLSKIYDAGNLVIYDAARFDR